MHTRHPRTPMRDICDIYVICDICNMLKAKFKKMTEEEERRRRKKEKVGVRIRWIISELKIYSYFLSEPGFEPTELQNDDFLQTSA